ncbi:Gfo/Idh/MocA family protein [Labrys wisconsinensis]|uniref:Dehydrogenase n=1 Tax=Labrys wisconsinensis TaxID=425677 RepID=A0ABU0J8G2_9HYPH|nr:Gfo/Idh/MocA family oxidoreductase [Labrys wisconsinensis]MDQ0469890.1 putative dehydrogenase [Labrys wisconsinensis]
MINLAMVGLGWWGRKMVDVVQGHSDVVRIARVVEPNTNAARPFAGERDLPLSASLEEALHDPDVAAVVLATPHALHDEQIRMAAAAGKHVFCEKPLALTRAGAESLVGLCREAGLVLGMGHERRFEPPMAALLADIDAGRLGRILQIEANFSHDKFLSLSPDNWRLDPAHAPAGGMTATGIHLTDLATRILGPARAVTVDCERLVSDLPSGDTISAFVQFHGGGTAYVSASLSYPFISRFAVYGAQGWVEIRDRAHVEAPDGWVVTKGLKGRPITVEEVGKAEPVLWNLEAFGRAVAGEAPYPITGEQLVNNIALLEAIVTASKSKQTEPVA